MGSDELISLENQLYDLSRGFEELRRRVEWLERLLNEGVKNVHRYAPSMGKLTIKLGNVTLEINDDALARELIATLFRREGVEIGELAKAEEAPLPKPSSPMIAAMATDKQVRYCRSLIAEMRKQPSMNLELLSALDWLETSCPALSSAEISDVIDLLRAKDATALVQRVKELQKTIKA